MRYYIKAWNDNGEEIHDSIVLPNELSLYDRSRMLIKAAENIYFSKYKHPTWHAEFTNVHGEKINL